MNKIAIIGTATTSIEMADRLDDSWIIYSCNGAFNQIKRTDLHFELHDIDYLKRLQPPAVPEYFEFLKAGGDKVMLNKAYKEFPDALIYPLKKILGYFGSPYFNNTIALMLAHALYNHDNISDISLIGVDMAGDGEYAGQRSCCEFYLGYARARGIRIHLPPMCPLLKTTHIYGFETPPAYVVSSKQKQKKLIQVRDEAEEAFELAKRNLHHVNGMIDFNDNMIRTFG